MFAGEPEDIVAIDNAPHRRKRIAKPEVDAADARFGEPSRVSGRVRFLDNTPQEIRIHQAFERLEPAAILLAKPRFAHRPLFLFEKVRRDARDQARRRLEALPIVAAARPGIPEEAAFAIRIREADEPPLRDREHGPHRAIKIVRHPRRLVDDEQIDMRIPTNHVLPARQTDDSAQVAQLDLFRGEASFDSVAEQLITEAHELEDFARLPMAARHEHDVRHPIPHRLDQAEQSDDGGFACLPNSS